MHCAAISEVHDIPAAQQIHALRSVNVSSGTLNLARQAASWGVKRFIFLSSIKVNGDSTRLGKPFFLMISLYRQIPPWTLKLDAERGLQHIAQDTGMELVIIRPPMVYGPGVRGNFRMLIKLVEYEVPVPLSKIKNQRSFMGIDNLVDDLLIVCISHPEAANQILLASDDNDLSTTKLLRGIAQAMGKPSGCFHVHQVCLAPLRKFWINPLL